MTTNNLMTPTQQFSLPNTPHFSSPSTPVTNSFNMQSNMQQVAFSHQLLLQQNRAAAMAQRNAMMQQNRTSVVNSGRSTPIAATPRAQNQHIVSTLGHKAFGGSDVHYVNKSIVVGGKEKRYIRLLWGDGMKGHESRWVGFAPAGWKMNTPLDQDSQLLGFFLKPKLCDRTTKTNKRGCSGWVTLSIDCERRAIKATIDGWTLGKVFIPTWLLGRVMHPVAVAERGCPVRIDIATEQGCEKVIRAGFSPLATLKNEPLANLVCRSLKCNFQQEIIGMMLNVGFDKEGNVKAVDDSSEVDYVSYSAIDMGLADESREVIPLVINDQHAFRCLERGLWDLFYANDLTPLDYLSERMSAIIRKIFEAKQRRRRRQYTAAMTKLAHLRHILFYMANRDQQVVEDANSRVRWFLMNTRSAGVHRELTPDLCQLLVCLAVSDYDWEDVAIPFFSEALQRALPNVIEQSAHLKWVGQGCCELEDMFEAVMKTPNSMPETLMQVFVAMKILKPSDTCRTHMKRTGEEQNPLERVSAEELCCGIASLSKDLQSLLYERSVRKDEIKKAVLKREWHTIFTREQWTVVESAIDNPTRLRGMLFRARMLAECHGTTGLPTSEMFHAVDSAHELGKTAESFDEVLAGMRLTLAPDAGDNQMYSVLKDMINLASRKGYLAKSYLDEISGVLSARQMLRLSEEGKEKLRRQSRAEPKFSPEVLPAFCEVAASTCSSESAYGEPSEIESSSSVVTSPVSHHSATFAHGFTTPHSPSHSTSPPAIQPTISMEGIPQSFVYTPTGTPGAMTHQFQGVTSPVHHGMTSPIAFGQFTPIATPNSQHANYFSYAAQTPTGFATPTGMPITPSFQYVRTAQGYPVHQAAYYGGGVQTA